MNQQEIPKILQSVAKFFSPIVYLLIWYLFLILLSKNIPSLSFNSDSVLFVSFVVFSLGLITKSTAWLIGHEKFGLKGDSRSRIINFHKNDSGDYWFDLLADNPELLKDKDIREFIEKLTAKQEEDQ
ncbi:MAG: hypothetical protein A2632_02855 [Candidatus Pacebacteria bacterium RIFCSPHIGHO2_01_FULL_46_16]|nr:MAG: hypothetical protein A2632_02855 [Candidatus Pacebacteria bacterium RIFCSPHIGHO2_01_FULL_46_16]OGJ21168.1 MAG: hypothetical protein A3J60_01290 [Candidatus Pacebacteria bacterium RIFCSPHIGHO2_02_FULL_46_9]OGJ38938.1 MAG: hypothetical protein A3A82_02170 [Candidatus Pacebacteria bacterium RIFCSPLOWO2_01_FULL_47_12]